MTFQIIRVYTIYDGRNGNDGFVSGAQPLPMSYHSEALAHKLASRFTDQHGEDYYAVVAYGESVFTRRRFGIPAVDDFDGMPF